MTNKQAERLLDDMRAMHPNRTLDLAPRQQQILVSMADGATIKTIAAELGLAPETVKRTSRETRRKLGARNTTHAVAIALREGLIE